MTYDIFAEIAELRAELASGGLTKRERAGATKRLAALTAEAEATKGA